MIFSPDYYKRFKCIADKCTDSCCVGWEIDVDGASLEKYKSDNSPIARELMSSIDEDAEIPYIRLSCDGRCPFLDGSGLCRVISAKGEDYIPDICKNHPRYYNEISGFTECSLGLACPEAARIILSITEKPKSVIIDNSPTTCENRSENRSRIPTIYENVVREMYNLRETLFELAFDKSFSVAEILAGLVEGQSGITDYLFGGEGSLSVSAGDVGSLYSVIRLLPKAFSSLELLDESLRHCFEVEPSHVIEIIERRGDGLRPIIYYFLHRYFLAGAEYGDFDDRLTLTALLTLIYLLITEGGARDEGAVLFSKNVEYSTENIDILLGIIAEIE